METLERGMLAQQMEMAEVHTTLQNLVGKVRELQSSIADLKTEVQTLQARLAARNTVARDLGRSDKPFFACGGGHNSSRVTSLPFMPRLRFDPNSAMQPLSEQGRRLAEKKRASEMDEDHEGFAVGACADPTQCDSADTLAQEDFCEVDMGCV